MTPEMPKVGVPDAAVCPMCEGRGGIAHFVCCGRGRSECCGEPDNDFEPCHVCGGSGNLPIEATP